MKILSTHPRGFLTWNDSTRFEPALGLTLITGPNGSGKTALGLELPAWLLWGETVRGTSPPGNATGDFMGPDGMRYAVGRAWARGGKNNSVGLVRANPQEGPTQDLTGQTATETQERIDRIFGSWRRFAATRVFSRRLLNRFGSATDKERKALLEEVLGLDRFERAYRWAREDRSRRADAATAVRAECITAERVQVQAQNAYDSMMGGSGPSRSAQEIGGLLSEARLRRDAASAAAVELEAKAKRAKAALDAAESRVASARADADAGERRMRALVTAEQAANAPQVCPTCRRPLDMADREQVRQHNLDEIARESNAVKTARARQAEMGKDVAPLRAAHSVVSAKMQAEAQAWQVADREATRLAAELAAAQERDGKLAKLRALVQDAARVTADAVVAENVAKRDLAVADAAVAVLGPKGARARLLEGSLALLEVEANYVLPRLGGKVQAVKIRGSRPRASGDGSVDEVSIEVVGAGGGEYKGASDGEQVRLDVALILGLARISGDTGYLCFDEVFDPLDEVGLAGVSEVLEELSRERQVVVLSHNARFQDLLPGAVRFRAVPQDNGTSLLEAA